MRTPEEIIEASKYEFDRGDSSGNIDIIREIDEEKLEIGMQEYAEEYAKALILSFQKFGFPESSEQNEIIAIFNESLKRKQV